MPCTIRVQQSKTSRLYYKSTPWKNQHSTTFWIINVQIDPMSGTAVASNRLLTGNHWTVVATDFDAKLSFYGDSLGYPVPTNLVVETQQVFTELNKLLNEHITTAYPILALHKTVFDAEGKHVCSRECCNFPVQTCSFSCGVIVIAFVAVASFCPKEIWQYVQLPQIQCHPVKSLLRIYHHPSTYAQYLRNVLATWLLTKKINVQNVVDISIFDVNKRLLIPLPESKKCKSVRTDHHPSLTLKRKRMDIDLINSYKTGAQIRGNILYENSKSIANGSATAGECNFAERDKLRTKKLADKERKSDKAITDKIENSHSSLNCFTIADTRNSEIPHEIAYLFPDSYNYIVDQYTRHTPKSFLGAETQTFSLQAWINAEDQTKAVQWIDDFEKTSKTTYRITRGTQISGQRILFKTVRHCQHQQKKLTKTQLSKQCPPSDLKRALIQKSIRNKKTSCPSTFILRLHPKISSTVAAHPNHLCMIDLKYCHNHPVNSAHVLSFRPVDNAVI